ncbi:hypothetical protein KCP74_25275 [Salmonella enterica subsp. enterica]|nr:hypothetical protein KCP74_25275 [Salmonella enterica subsp. enterica]
MFSPLLPAGRASLCRLFITDDGTDARSGRRHAQSARHSPEQNAFTPGK